MKSKLTILLAFLCYFNVNAQDTIMLKNGKEINAFITEKTHTKISYKPDSVTNDDTTYSMKLSKIRTIHYDNGDVDLLSSQNPRSIFPLGIYAGISFVYEYKLLLHGSVDYLFTPNLSAEINFGCFNEINPNYYCSFGGKYWFANKYSKSGFSPFVGLLCVGTGGIVDGGMSSASFLEVPAGISYITKFGLQTSLQLSYLTNFNYMLGPNIEFRVGWRFKSNKHTNEK
jgi:hypothetical protein